LSAPLALSHVELIVQNIKTIFGCECEARFFLGELALHNGQTQQARDALREVTLGCGPAEPVYSAAVAEAKLLPR
jgi:hypothetical protein